MLKSLLLLCFINFTIQSDSAIVDALDRKDYLVELVLVLVILLLIANYISGIKSNKDIVMSFFHYNFNIFKNNFYHIGLQLKELPELDKPIDEIIDDQNIVEEDSPNFFRTYFTGRENLKYCILSLNTKRRQDFLVSLIYSILWPEKDRILLEAAIPDQGCAKGLLYLIKTNKVKNVVQEYEDLKMLCKKYNVNGINQKKLAIFAEHSELLEFMLDKNAQEVINELGHLIESMEMSDCYQNQLSTGTTVKLIVSLDKCKPKDYQNAGKLCSFFFDFIDKLSLYKPSAKTLEKYKNNRTKFNKKQTQDQQTENNANSKEERIKNMSNAEREKYMEKMKKRQKNKMQKKMKVKQM